MNPHRIYIYAPVAGEYPLDLEQALAQGEQLRRGGGGQTVPEALLTLAGELEAYADRWAEGVSEEDDEGEDDLQELLGNLKERVRAAGVPVISFTLPHEEWKRLLHEMVVKAGPLGLVVADDQTLTAFLPEGRVLPEARTAAWRAVVAEFEREEAEARKEEHLPRTLREYVAWAGPVFDAHLAKHGFVERVSRGRAEVSYFRKNGIINQEVYGFFQKSNGFFEFLFWGMLIIHCPLVVDIIRRFGFPSSDDRVFHIQFSNQAKIDVYDGHQPSGRAVIDYEIKFFDTHGLSVANMAVDIQGLDRVMNDLVGVSERSRLFLDSYIPHCLVVAKLAGRPDFEALVEKYNAMVDWGGCQRARYLGQGEKLIQYLRDEVKPLG